jgi:hypothetical protein
MENFKVQTTKVVNAEFDLPQFIQVGELNFIKIINERMHLHVSKHDVKTELYADIKLKTNRVLYWFQDHQWQEITEDEFLSAYYETQYLIEKNANIL